MYYLIDERVSSCYARRIVGEDNTVGDDNTRYPYAGRPFKPSHGQTNLNAAKLTATAVAEMRRLRAAGATQGALARMFGVSVVQVGRICRGEAWQEFGGRVVQDAEQDLTAALQRQAMAHMPTEEELAASIKRTQELLSERPSGPAAPPSACQPRTVPLNYDHKVSSAIQRCVASWLLLLATRRPGGADPGASPRPV